MRASRSVVLILILIAFTIILSSCGGDGSGFNTSRTSSGETTTIKGKVALSATSASRSKPMLIPQANEMMLKASANREKANRLKTADSFMAYTDSLNLLPQSGMDEVYQRSGLASAIMIGQIRLYDAEHPEWLFPIAESTLSPDGTYTLDVTQNSQHNALLDPDNPPPYVDGEPIPAGKYTLIASTDPTQTGELLIGVQPVVKYFIGEVFGNDLVIQDSDAVPTVVSVFGSTINLDETFGGDDFDIPVNGAIQVTFSMAMARASIYNIQKSGIEVALANSALAIEGKWKISPDLMSATFYPIGNLVEGEQYRVTVFGGDSLLLPDPNTQITVKNVYGKTLNSNVYGYFIAGQEDVTAPEAIRVSPEKSVKENTPITSPLRIAADEPLDLNNIEVASSPTIGDKPNVIFIGKSAKIPNFPFVYEIIPSDPLALKTNYYMTVKGGTDLAQNEMIDLTFNFTTEQTTDGIDPAAPLIEQDAQAEVKDVFGKWVRSLSDRSVAGLASYMAGDFTWLNRGYSGNDINRDGKLSLGEFTAMLSQDFERMEGCGTIITGSIIGNITVADEDTLDLVPYDTARLFFTISETQTNTTNSECQSEGDDDDKGSMTLNLKLLNGAWMIVSGAEFETLDPVGVAKNIVLISPSNNSTLGTTADPTFKWYGLANVSTYAVILIDARQPYYQKGWVALVNGGDADSKLDVYDLTYTGNTGLQEGLTLRNGEDRKMYVLCNYDGSCNYKLSQLFGLGYEMTGGILEGGNYYWSVVGLDTLTIPDLISTEYNSMAVAEDVIGSGESAFFTVAGEWKDIKPYLYARSGESFTFSRGFGGYDVGSADNVTLVINTPAGWANGTVEVYHSGIGYSQNTYTLDANGSAVIDLALYNRGNYMNLTAYQPGSAENAQVLTKRFNILTTGGLPPGIQIKELIVNKDYLGNENVGRSIPLDEWNQGMNNTVATVDIIGYRNDSTVSDLRVDIYANNGRYDDIVTINSDNFVIANVPVFEGYNSINIQDTNWENNIARDYVSLEVSPPGGSVYVPPVRISMLGFTPTESYSQSVYYDVGANGTATLDVSMDNLVTGYSDYSKADLIFMGWYPWNTYDLAGWDEYTSDPSGYSSSNTGVRGVIFNDGSWERLDIDRNVLDSGPSLSSITIPLYNGVSMMYFRSAYESGVGSDYGYAYITTTNGALGDYVFPMTVQFTVPGGSTATADYETASRSRWTSDADSIVMDLSMVSPGGNIYHNLSTQTDWMEISRMTINSASSPPAGSWYKMDANWQKMTGIGNEGDSISSIPIDLYMGANYIDICANQCYSLVIETTGGGVFTPPISSVTAYDGPFTPGAAEVIPQYDSSSYADFQTDVDSMTFWVDAEYDDTWNLDGSGNMINGIAFRHNAQGIWRTEFADLNTDGNALSSTIDLITGTNWIDICYKPVPDPFDDNYIMSCGYWYNAYVTTSGGTTPPQWLHVDSPEHDMAIPFNATIDVAGHIDNSTDGFHPDSVYAYLINTTPGGGWGDYAYFDTWYSAADPRHMSYDPVTMEFSFSGKFYANMPQTIYISSCGNNLALEHNCHYLYSYVNNSYDQNTQSGKPGPSGRPSAPMIPERYYGIPR